MTRNQRLKNRLKRELFCGLYVCKMILTVTFYTLKEQMKGNYNLDKGQQNCYRRRPKGILITGIANPLDSEDVKSKQPQAGYGREETKKIVFRNLYKTALLAVWTAEGELIRIKKL